MIYTDSTSRALTYLLKQPDLHIDMTETIYRGVGEILYAQSDGVLLLVHHKDTGTPLLYQHSAVNVGTSEKLLALMKAPLPIVAHQACGVSVIADWRGGSVNRCIQAGWPSFEPPKCNSAIEIWPLDLGDLPMVEQHYELIDDPVELAERISSGNMFGACIGDQIVGFIGIHTEGCMGMLTVLEPYRRRGVGTALETDLIRRELRQGHIPYSQIFSENQISIALQKKVGMKLSADPIWWLLP